MCGVVALIEHRGAADWSAARRALNRLSHRGPDDEGLIGISAAGRAVPANHDARIILGHRRLSILDLTPAGHQPMICPETGDILVFNGEIYNFIELRKELEASGVRFRTESDTEVILAGLRTWGDDVFPRLNGMWAIVLFEAKTGEILVSRDRLGVKPLYFWSDARRMIFASEINGVRAAVGGPISINDAIVYDYLVGSMVDHTSSTFFKGIEQVPAGALWRLRPDGVHHRSQFHRWSNDMGDVASDPVALRQLMVSSVELRLRSDAPTVALLSGGLDSSIITAVAAHTTARRSCFRGAFSYGYSDKSGAAYDEVAIAAEFMRTVAPGHDHRIHLAQSVPTIDELLELVSTQQQPFTTPSLLAHQRMYRQIRSEGFKVVLTGEGADEIMGGYIRQYLNRMARDALIEGNLRRAGALIRSPYSSPRLIANRLFWDLPRPLLLPVLIATRRRLQVMNQDFLIAHKERFEEICEFNALSTPERLRSDVLKTNLPQILRYSDLNSMIHGVEVRGPFLDYRVVELALRIPVDAKLGPRGGKLLLRQAFEDLLPASTGKTQKFRGFGQAEESNFRLMCDDDLFSAIRAEVADYLDIPKLRRSFSDTEGHPDFWMPICFALWASQLGHSVAEQRSS